MAEPSKKDGKAATESKENKEEAAAAATVIQPSNVVLHPLVLLSVVDHYNRVSVSGTKRRVVGILLGTTFRGTVDVTNSYAVPFEEDPKDPSIWFLDHNYHEEMFTLFKKVNAKEKVVGWYSTGPTIRPPDLEINELMRNYTQNPVFVIIDTNPKDELEIPTTAYLSVESRAEEKSKAKRTFVHLPSEIGALEAEEVGVEHLLRNIVDQTVSSVADHVQAKVNALYGLRKRMEQLYEYVQNVVDGKLPVNHQIIYNLQDIFNLSPDLQIQELVDSLTTTNNDNMMVIFISSLVRSIVALHSLITNKLENRAHELKAEKGEKDGKKAGDEKAEAKDNKDKDGKKEAKSPESGASESKQ